VFVINIYANFTVFNVQVDYYIVTARQEASTKSPIRPAVTYLKNSFIEFTSPYFTSRMGWKLFILVGTQKFYL